MTMRIAYLHRTLCRLSSVALRRAWSQALKSTNVDTAVSASCPCRRPRSAHMCKKQTLSASPQATYMSEVWPSVLCMEASTAAAFVAAGIALIIGLLGPAMSARTTRETLRHQRKLATDERLWHRRAETYVALLQWAGVIRTVGTSEEELSEPALMRRTANELENAY